MKRIGPYGPTWDTIDVPVVNGIATLPDGRTVASSARVVRVPYLIPATQTGRLLHYLRKHPGCSSLEIIQDLGIVNTTGRVSDLRGEGYVIDAVRGPDRTYRYYLREPQPVQMAAFG